MAFALARKCENHQQRNAGSGISKMVNRKRTIEIRLEDWGEWYVRGISALGTKVSSYDERVDLNQIHAAVPNYMPHKTDSSVNKYIHELPDKHIQAITAKYAYRMKEKRALTFCRLTRTAYYAILSEGRAFVAGRLGLTL